MDSNKLLPGILRTILMKAFLNDNKFSVQELEDLSNKVTLGKFNIKQEDILAELKLLMEEKLVANLFDESKFCHTELGHEKAIKQVEAMRKLLSKSIENKNNKD